MKKIIVGDVHGCAGALKALLEKIPIGDGDRLIMLGDLFDRGPESWEVFGFVKELERKLGERFTLLRGNHEDYLLQEKLSLGQRMIWERVGRGATAASFKAHGGRMEDAAPWLKEKCRLFYRDEDIQCVHAGLLIDPIEVNDTHTLVHDHGIVMMNRYAGPLTIVGHIALEAPTWFAGDGETTEALEYGEELVLPEKGVICIDTGSGKGGWLTAMVVENGKYCLVKV